MITTLLLVAFVAGIFVGLLRSNRIQKPGYEPVNILEGVSRIITRIRQASTTTELEKSRTIVPAEDIRRQGYHGLFTREEVVSHFEPSSWQRLAFEDFKAKVLARGSNLKTFPCIYATMGFRSGEHRYVFLQSDDPSEPQNIRLVGPALQEYLAIARSLGSNTSLAIFAAPSTRPISIEEHNSKFWGVLRGLRIVDPSPWPAAIPSKTESSEWTFCYANEPIFPVMLTPSHGKRYSRQMSVPVIAIQPKWVLDQLLNTKENRDAATGKVRKLLAEYDSIDVSPDLTGYGVPGTSESRQLCLADENQTVLCPYQDFDR
ncbi:uncharacterized protein HMPREF1541_06242 [Cyphellophora europaea CBS 101466]|uniref:YqcI/YcgG family protein n=1 Tax=Cyphellophora europaea (strain CBS 101466) TaxID=1220924 RepID=W2RNU7_CYPE1|nr:uncharacterized protein HMPREF1541_06242 [Cyphellophora europaea CBS 101466]ETN38211.1 hypothetical protein HMPREF1541_06242 [Cyphellophora europaea CBS 101466]